MNKELEEVINALELVVEDIDLFFDGSWIPENDSMEATLNNVILALEFLKQLKKERN